MLLRFQPFNALAIKCSYLDLKCLEWVSCRVAQIKSAFYSIPKVLKTLYDVLHSKRRFIGFEIIVGD